MAQQAWPDAQIQVKFVVEKYTTGSLSYAKFSADLWRGLVWGRETHKFQNSDKFAVSGRAWVTMKFRG